MKKITLSLTFLLFVTFFNLSAQNSQVGNRDAITFYPTIDKLEKNYNISVDLYELGNVKYIEAELYDANEVKLTSKLFELVSKNKKYYISQEGDKEKEVFLYDINFDLENKDNTVSYPKVKIKTLNQNYQIMDFSQKVFY